jgi:hypothetical protein
MVAPPAASQTPQDSASGSGSDGSTGTAQVNLTGLADLTGTSIQNSHAGSATQSSTAADWQLSGAPAPVAQPATAEIAGAPANPTADARVGDAQAAGNAANSLLAESTASALPAKAGGLAAPAKGGTTPSGGADTADKQSALKAAVNSAAPPIAQLPASPVPPHPKNATPAAASVNSADGIKDTTEPIPSTASASKDLTHAAASSIVSNVAPPLAAPANAAISAASGNSVPAQVSLVPGTSGWEDKQGSTSVKGAASAGQAGKGKVDDAGAQPSSTSADSTLPPMKITEATAAFAGGGNGQSAGSNDSAMQQAVQSVLAGASPTPAPVHAAQQGPVAPADVAPAPQPANAQAAEPALPAINSAQLMQNMHGSEMRVGMNSAEFGNISINTAVTHQSVSTQITLDHAELGRTLALHLPSIEQKLGTAYGLQARVELRDSNNLANGDSSGSAPNNNRQSQGRSANTGSPSPSTSVLTSASAAVNSPSLPASTSRLDILI